MFGTYRTLLAMLVMVGHLAEPGELGIYAVFGFYVLSGFLMTTVMHQDYGYTGQGRLRFLLNRALRLFPLYWIVCIFTLIAIALIGPLTWFHPAIFTPNTLPEWLMNIFMMFPEQSMRPRLSPATWALTVELFFYLLICLGISQNRTRLLLWLSLSIGYTIWLIATNAPFEARYFPIFAASLPFAIGSGIHFLNKDSVKRWFSRSRFSLHHLLFLFSFNFVFCYLIRRVTGFDALLGIGFYLNLLLVTALTLCLLVHPRGLLPKYDALIGAYSYPIYLSHWLAGGIATVILFGSDGDTTFLKKVAALGLAVPIVIAIGFVMIRFIDMPVQKLRLRTKTF